MTQQKINKCNPILMLVHLVKVASDSNWRKKKKKIIEDQPIQYTQIWFA